jgi:protein SCO1/2
MNFRKSWPLLLGVALIAAALGAMLARMLSQAPVPLVAGTWLPEARPLAPFTASSTTGGGFDRAALNGRPHLLFFGFTYCPDVCPTTLATVAAVMRQLPQGLTDLQLVFVSVDPERDSIPAMTQYLHAFDPGFVGLRTGRLADLQPLLQSLGAIAARVDLPGGGYTMDHTAALYLLDRQGRYRAVFTAPFDRQLLGADLARIAKAGAL